MEKRRKNIDRLFEIMALLIWDEPLPEYCHEHKLHGNLEGFWDCHIEGDWVLLYEEPRSKTARFFVGEEIYYTGGVAPRLPINLMKVNKYPLPTLELTPIIFNEQTRWRMTAAMTPSGSAYSRIPPVLSSIR